MNFFERFLSLWVLLCIVLGVALGQGFPAVFQSLGDLQVARINLPVGVLIWVMIIPMLDRKSTRLNSSHIPLSRMPSSA